jgi:alkaline phosphatase
MKKYSSVFHDIILLLLLFLLGAGLAGCFSHDGDDDSAPPPSETPPENPPPVVPPPGPAKYIILFIGDGMSLENEIAASRYLYGKDYSLTWHSFPYQAYVTTWDVDTYNAYAGDLGEPFYDETTFDPLLGYNPAQGGTAPYPLDTTGNIAYLLRAYTDSASAATAYATGLKTDSGNISWLRNDPLNGAIETIGEKLRAQKSAAFGVVSTMPFSHATPAAFVSHNTSRSNYYQIADEIIGTTVPEVVIGGGHPSWNGSYMSTAQLDTLRSSATYTLVERVSGQDGGVNLLYAAASLPSDRKLFGLFGGTGGIFEPPVPRDNPGYPGFMVEGENPSLSEATQAALTVLARNQNGFFLMVEGGDIDQANHANNFAWMVGAMWQLEEAVAAAVEFIDQPGDDMNWDNTLLIVTADHCTGGMRLNDALPLGKGDLPRQSGSSYPDNELSYFSGSHTNEPVTLYARGANLDLFSEYEGVRYPGTKLLDNTEVYLVMSRAAGLQ